MNCLKTFLFPRALSSFYGLLALSLLVNSASAGLVTGFSDIQNWTGTGSNQAAMVVQWNDGANSPESVAWGYRWSSGTPTVENMLFAIAGDIAVSSGTPPSPPTNGLDTRLSLNLTYSAYGYFLLGVSYDQIGLGGDFTSTVRDQEGDGAGNAPSWGLYDLGGSSTVWPTAAVEPANFGMGTLNLASGSWYGWAWTVGFSGPPNWDPVPYTFDQPFAAAAVPEPSAGVLLLSGGMILWGLRRQREKRRI